MSKIFIGRDGTLIISDAERKALPILEQLSPGFKIKVAPPHEGFISNFQRNSDTYDVIGISAKYGNHINDFYEALFKVTQK